MGLNFAVDELYATGWSTLDSSGCEFLEGRQYPGVERVQREFTGQGFTLSIRRVELFDCFRAEWRTTSGDACGAIVAQCQTEAAVYALAQLRRQAASASAQPSA